MKKVFVVFIIMNLFLLVLSLNVFAENLNISEEFTNWNVLIDYQDLVDISENQFVSNTQIARNNYTLGLFRRNSTVGIDLTGSIINGDFYSPPFDDFQVFTDLTLNGNPGISGINAILYLFTFRDDALFNAKNITVVKFRGNTSIIGAIDYFVSSIYMRKDGTCPLALFNGATEPTLQTLFGELCSNAYGITDNRQFSSDILTTGTPQNISKSFSGQNIFRNASNIKYIYFLVYAGNGQNKDIFLDTFFLEDVSLGLNQLPIFEVTVNESVLCINETGEEAVFNLNWDIFDPENDVIYYADLEFQEKYINRFIRYDIKDCGFFSGCTHTQNFDFVKNVLPNGTRCTINEVNELDLTKFNLAQFPDINNDVVYMLAIADICIGNPDYVYFVDDPMSDITYSTDIYGFQTANEQFVLLFEDSLRQQDIFDIRFTILFPSGDLRVQYFDGAAYQTLIQTAMDSELLRFSVISDNTTGTQVNNLILRSPVNQTFNITRLSNDFIKYITIEDDTGIFYQNNFFYSGIIPELIFTTNQPSTFTQTRVGRFSLDISVSDSVNQPGNFSTETLVFNVQQCAKFEEEGFTPTTKSVGESVKVSITSVCTSLSNFPINPTGFKETFDACTFVRFLVIAGSILLAIIILVIVGILMPTMTIGSGLTAFSLGMVVGNIFIVDLGTNLKIITAMIFAVGVVMTILGVMSANRQVV